MFDIEKFASDFFKLPAPALKKRWAAEYEAITTHTQGLAAKRLIKTRRPYEDTDIQKYRLDNYEAVTKGPFSRAKTNLTRVFSSSQVTISTGDDKVQEFIDGQNFDDMDLRSFWSRKVCSRMIDDPNGVLVWWVNTVPAANERVRPTAHLVLSKNIKHYTPEVFSWLSNEKSEVSAPDPVGGGKRILRNIGEVYYIITPEGYYKLAQVGRHEEKQFDLVPHYDHKLGYLPVYVLGGEEVTAVDEKTNEDLAWNSSFFCSAIPFANECVRQFSDHQGVLVTAGFPLREMTPIKCRAKGCVDGIIRTPVEGSDVMVRSNCAACGGRGTVPPFGPYGVLLREQKSVLNPGESTDTPMVRFLAPETSILEFGSKTWRDYLEDVERELNLLFTDEAQSGVAKDIDREDKVATLDKIGHHLFLVLMKSSILTIGRLLFSKIDESSVNITLPPTFVVRTEQSLTAEMKAIREGNAPQMMIAAVTVEYARKRFPGDKVFTRSTEILASYDVLFGMTDAEVAAWLSSGSGDETLARRHRLAFTALQRLIAEKGPGVLDATDIFTLIDTAVEELVPASDTFAAGGAAGGDGAVQDTALNGAQVSSLVEVISLLSAGTVTADVAKAMIRAAFPLIDEALIDEMVSGVKKAVAPPSPKNIPPVIP